jgi:hypothetical protein
MLQRMWLIMALSGLLSGVKRTSTSGNPTSAFDPKRTSDFVQVYGLFCWEQQGELSAQFASFALSFGTVKGPQGTFPPPRL